MMFKSLLLQSWYKLSDLGLEKQLARDLLFRRFTGLDIADSVPDHPTFWRFRQTQAIGNEIVIEGCPADLLKPEIDKLTQQLFCIHTAAKLVLPCTSRR